MTTPDPRTAIKNLRTRVEAARQQNGGLKPFTAEDQRLLDLARKQREGMYDQ